MKVKITVVTARLIGKPKEQEITVELDASGVSLAEVLNKAGIPTNGMQVSVDDKPVSESDMHVKDGARVRLAKSSPMEQRRVLVSERASGS